MKFKFYGVRGSYNVPSDSDIDTRKYGGSTSCFTVYNKDKDNNLERVIIDAGNGIIKLGRDMASNTYGKENLSNIVMCFTHLHPDHQMEFPFFAPNHIPGSKVHLFGMEALKKHVGKILERNMLPPNFPIEYGDLKSERKHHIIKDKDTIAKPYLKTMTIKAMQARPPSHPQQGAMHYQIIDNNTGKSIVCAWDLESKSGGDKLLVNFVEESDVLIHDTQYTEEEYFSDKFIVQGFGHSTYEMAIENALQSGIKKELFCTHFNPAHGDERLDEIQENMNNLVKSKKLPFDITLARQGIEYSI